MSSSKLEQICYGHLLYPALLSSWLFSTPPLAALNSAVNSHGFFFASSCVEWACSHSVEQEAECRKRRAPLQEVRWLHAFLRKTLVHSGEDLRILVVFVYSFVGHVLSEKAFSFCCSPGKHVGAEGPRKTEKSCCGSDFFKRNIHTFSQSCLPQNPK